MSRSLNDSSAPQNLRKQMEDSYAIWIQVTYHMCQKNKPGDYIKCLAQEHGQTAVDENYTFNTGDSTLSNTHISNIIDTSHILLFP